MNVFVCNYKPTNAAANLGCISDLKCINDDLLLDVLLYLMSLLSLHGLFGLKSLSVSYAGISHNRKLFVFSRRKEGEIPRYTWTRTDGKDLPEGYELLDYDRKLIIHGVKSQDTGEYECQARYRTSGVRKTVSLALSCTYLWS